MNFGPTNNSLNGFADWLVGGTLRRLGESLDRLTGRKPQGKSSLAISELVERLKRLLDSEAREVPGKGKVVPHDLQLKMQWDKFAADDGETVDQVQNHLLAAAADHISDSRYYTLAPLKVEIKTDYFTEGVRLVATFGEFGIQGHDMEFDITMPQMAVEDGKLGAPETEPEGELFTFDCVINLGSTEKLRTLSLRSGERITIGRGGSNGLVIDDNSVSKIHASIVAGDEGVLSIADTGSTNGTFVNGGRISYGKAVEISSDDIVKIGSIDVRFVQANNKIPEADMGADVRDAETGQASK